MIYAINYDLKRPGQNYTGLYTAIKHLGSSWWHYLGSTWLIETHLTSAFTASDERHDEPHDAEGL